MALPSMLKGLPDMERGITRIFHRTANPAEFVQVLQALVQVAPQLGLQVRHALPTSVIANSKSSKSGLDVVIPYMLWLICIGSIEL